jgi:hypothetical protein
MDNLGVNLAGVDVILKLTHRLTRSEDDNRRLNAEVQQLRDRLAKIA